MFTVYCGGDQDIKCLAFKGKNTLVPWPCWSSKLSQSLGKNSLLKSSFPRRNQIPCFSPLPLNKKVKTSWRNSTVIFCLVRELFRAWYMTTRRRATSAKTTFLEGVGSLKYLAKFTVSVNKMQAYICKQAEYLKFKLMQAEYLKFKLILPYC